MQRIDILAIASDGERPCNLVVAAGRANATGCLVFNGSDDVADLLDRLNYIRRFTEEPVALLIGNVEIGQVGDVIRGTKSVARSSVYYCRGRGIASR